MAKRCGDNELEAPDMSRMGPAHGFTQWPWLLSSEEPESMAFEFLDCARKCLQTQNPADPSF